HNCTQYQLFSRKFPTQRIRGRMQSTSRARSFNSTSLFWFRVPPQFAASLTPTNPEFASAVVANHASARALLPILTQAKSTSADTRQSHLRSCPDDADRPNDPAMAPNGLRTNAA